MPTLSHEQTRRPVHNKCYGIEIECVVDRHVAITHMHKFVGFFSVSLDGSVRDNGSGTVAVEFVSMPLPYSWLNKEINRLSKKIAWSDNDSCGIHVHVSRSCVSVKRINDLRVALRTMYSYGGGHKFEKLFGRRPTTYCDPTETRDRYTSVNILNSRTIEFRMFSGGDAAWAQECLRRTKLMVEYKGEYTYENLLKLFGLAS